MILFGLSGTNASGKDSVGEFLQKHYGFLFVSSSDLLRAEANKRGLQPSREVLRTISAEWRRADGLGVLVDKAVAYFNEQPKGMYKGLITGSLRNPGEADAIHRLDGKVIWTDADPHVRFERLRSRGRIDDTESFEDFLQQELAEMAHSGDEATLNMQGVKDLAGIYITNDTNSMDDFYAMITKALGLEEGVA